jgi:starvation-inducible outer membrane lipoprotein
MKKSFSQRLVVYFISLSLLLHGCTSMRPLEGAEDPDKLVSQINAGDHVMVTTKQGQKIGLKVTAITKEKIVGNNIDIAVADVEKIEVKRHDVVKTGGLILAYVVYVLVVLIITIQLHR